MEQAYQKNCDQHVNKNYGSFLRGMLSELYDQKKHLRELQNQIRAGFIVRVKAGADKYSGGYKVTINFKVTELIITRVHFTDFLVNTDFLSGDQCHRLQLDLDKTIKELENIF